MLRLDRAAFRAPLAAACLMAGAQAALAGAPLWLASLGDSAAPPAFHEFCARNPAECARRGPFVRRMPLDAARLAEVQAVNAQVNQSIREVSDQEQHGREDVWRLPTNGMGDCEDIALMKRHLLVQRGWPSSVLLMTVVATPEGEGHAVLTVVTDHGDLVLDNKNWTVAQWASTGHQFFTRQSQVDPRAWVAVGAAPETRVATRRGRARSN